ncbi:uncharacterized protein [Temnothorax longispinosus]|uniref:uncharacterized protein n=1 Tax=Temnothorax longispinosus TaxID=300112 RepID=UPI003A99A5FD
MADAEDSLYAIVLFLPKKESDNLIDLIPSSWITTKGKKVYCQYPDKKDYSKLEEWIVTLKKPEKTWEHFSVEIISYAHNLKQGKRRLKRAYTQIQVGSTDDDIPHKKSDAAPIVLNKALLSQALSNISDSLEVPDGSPDNSVDDPLHIDKAATENTYGNNSVDDPLRIDKAATRNTYVNTPCTKTKDEVQHLNNSNMQESSIPLLELDTLDILGLDTINTSTNNFNSDENKRPESPSMISTPITPYLKKRLMMRHSRLALLSSANNTSEISKGVIEVSPTQRSVTSKVKRCLKLKRKNPEHLNMRRKADRAKLNGWDCWECREYYKNLSLPEEELKKRMNQCSRHRRIYERPNTPEGFWDPVFPETLSSTY